MYGQIHCVIRDLVLSLFGNDKFQEVLEACPLNEDEHFMVFKQYPDSLTFALIDAVSERTKLHRDDVLKAFGKFFLTYCMKHGYDKMLRTMGADLVAFIQNLDSLHSLLSLSYKGIVAPSFSCFEDADGMLELHYYSSRPGFYPVCIGLMEAVGKELFNQHATVTVLSYGEEEIGNGRIMYHTVMKVKVTDLHVPFSRKRSSWALSATEQKGSQRPTLCPRNPGTESAIRAEDMSKACPYHILFDQNMCIKECGDNIRTLARCEVTPCTSFHDVATIVQPVMHQTLANIMKFINSVYVIAIHPNKDSREPFVIKGQMIWLPYSGTLMFIGSPRIHTLEDLKEMKLFMGDIPLYFGTRELLLLNQQRFAEIEIARTLDETTIELKKMSKALEEEKKKTETLLHEMLPSKIARQLTSGKMVKGERYKSCTVLFSDVVGFTDIASNCSAEEIINMLNDMYYRFDSYIECHGVYKVETIGDAYMAATGLPEIQVDHAARMADFAMDLIEESNYVISPATGKPIVIRVGMHSGEVVAGVIGTKKPRYDIYGDTVNTASRMESNSLPGCINVSQVTFSLLYPLGYTFKARGEIIIKGKGGMEAFFLTGYFHHLLTLPGNELRDLEDLVHPDPTTSVYDRDSSHCHSVTPVRKISFVDSQGPVQSKRVSIVNGLRSLGSKIFRRASKRNSVDFVPHPAKKSGSVTQSSPEHCGGDRKRSGMPPISSAVSSTKHKPIPDDSGQNSKAASVHKETRHSDEVTHPYRHSSSEVSHPHKNAPRKRTCFVCIVM
ncbi:guanylate cyclase soluble subunit beta-2-like [Littorina saxatilis]|uniref:guanylate cyclase n=1 Tax=Littorina saxatilis TaxID=31220 RepID=A0AAN9BAN5_9CAEN